MTERIPLGRIACRGVDDDEATILVYRVGTQISLVATAQKGGDAEVLLDADQVKSLAEDLLKSVNETER